MGPAVRSGWSSADAPSDPAHRRHLVVSGASVLLGAVSVFLGAGCATVVAPAPPLTGRLALTVAAVDAAPARSASLVFRWTGDAARGQLDLSTPLGNQLAAVRWDAGGAELRTADGLQAFETLDALGESLLGERLPLAALADWLRGRATAGLAFEPLDGRDDRTAPGRFRQAGWTVDLSGHADGRIDAERDGPPAVRLRIRLDPPQP